MSLVEESTTNNFLSRKAEKLLEKLREKPVWTAGELAEEMPKIHSALRELLQTEAVAANVELDLDNETMHVSPDEIYYCRHTVCIDIKYPSWDDAENDAYMLKRSGYDAYVDYESDKPHVVVELKPDTPIRFIVSVF